MLITSRYLNHYSNLRIQRPIACVHCSFSKAALPRTDSESDLMLEHSTGTMGAKVPLISLRVTINIQRLQAHCVPLNGCRARQISSAFIYHLLPFINNQYFQPNSTAIYFFIFDEIYSMKYQKGESRFRTLGPMFLGCRQEKLYFIKNFVLNFIVQKN